MKKTIYISNEQRQSIEAAISVNLSLRGETIVCPKIIFSPQDVQNEYAVIFINPNAEESPIVKFDATVLKHISIPIFAERITCHYYRAIGDITDVILNNFKNRISNRDYIKENLYLEAVNSERNKIFLDSVPKIELLDLSFICRINISRLIQNGCTGNRSIIIDNRLLNIMGLSVNELFDYAKNCDLNTYRAIPLNEDKKVPTYLIRNKTGIYGGAAIASMDVLRGLSDFLKSNLYILPQSIHELLIMPADEEDKIPIMTFAKALASGIPCSDDFLSDHLYLYNKVEKKIRVVDA
ncbi:hypothetical protein FYJ75_03455 [Roseburia sp. MUC/MUC-530-WT-4D]|uniref:Uncharacterized protein n=1 Tax=Roseburia porci TaxID=2605790 RepID=A0A6L5YNM5_9FIRM|nr:DUF5688 family protein [Roseburia porci]MST74094.1 hypothetical protein [Roseburia porci]